MLFIRGIWRLGDDSRVCRFFDSSQGGAFCNYAYVHSIFAVIPIVYYMRQKTAEFQGKESFIYEDVTVHAVGGEL